MTTIDLFAGPGGWDEGARLLGLPDEIVGVEIDADACATALAAGHKRHQADLTLLPVDQFGPFTGLIASPPCQAWSAAGKGLGKLDQPRILRHLERIKTAGRWLHYSRENWHDDRSPLVLEVVRWALAGRPEWIACEQVPAVLPFWQAVGDVLRDHGYSVDTGVLSAECYGVPQTRKRAILVAKLGGVAGLPPATHQPYSKRKPVDPDSPPPRWVSMAEALGWADDSLVGFARRADGGEVVEIGGEQYRARDLRSASEPAQVVTEKSRSWVLRQSAQSNATTRALVEPAPTITSGHSTAERVWTVMNAAGATGLAPRGVETPAATITGKGTAAWVHDAPATTVQGDPRIAPRGHHDRQFNGETVRVSVEEAARLQSYTDYPWQGSKTAQYRQIGDSVPPLLAAAILGHLHNIPEWRDVCMSLGPSTN